MKMTLYEYIEQTSDWEITVWDEAYDMECYFYNEHKSKDRWDKALNELSKLLEVKDIKNNGVIVNLSEVVEKHLDKFDNLFINNDIDSIMFDIDNIISGYVSEEWMEKFVEALKGGD